MRELTDEQEEALGLAYAHKNEQSQMYEGPAARAFLQLKDTRMLKVDGDLSGNALVERVLPAGVEHMSLVRESLAAAGVELLSADADRALRDLAWEETCARADGRDFSHKAEAELLRAYQELSRKKMVSIVWADNTAYHIYGVTDDGWKYVRAMVPAKEGHDVKIVNSPQFTQQVIGSANADASASASTIVTVSEAYRAIRDSNATEEQRRTAEDGIGEMERAASAHDLTAFAAGMEKAASVAKSVGTIASAVVPLVARLAGGM